jgi:hypothetical protein
MSPRVWASSDEEAHMDKYWVHPCMMSVARFVAYPWTITRGGPTAATVSAIAEDSDFGAAEATHINNRGKRTGLQ